MNDIRKRIIRNHVSCVLSHENMPVPYYLVERIIDALCCKHSNTDLADELEHLADEFRHKIEERESHNKELLDRISESLTDPEDLFMTRGNSRA